MSLTSLYGVDPPEPEQYICPVCGEDCMEIFTDDNNYPVGCDGCFMDGFAKWDAGEWWAKEKEGREADEGDQRYHQLKEDGF